MLLGTHYSGSEVNVWADPEILSDVGKHHGIFLVNHHYEVDWLFTWVVADAHNQVRSLITQLYSVDFSQSGIDVKKCVFNERTTKVCISCF